jgi:hypothetical protein
MKKSGLSIMPVPLLDLGIRYHYPKGIGEPTEHELEEVAIAKEEFYA